MKGRLIFGMLSMMLALNGCAKQDDGIVLSGIIEATEFDVYAEVGGRVESILKQEGDFVEAGEVVAVLDGREAQIVLAQAEAAVKQAEARLAELVAGTREEQVKQAEAAVKQAEAKLAELKSGSRPEQISQAEAKVREAKAALDEMAAGSPEQQVNQASMRVTEGETNYSLAKQNYEYMLKNLETVERLKAGNAATDQQILDAANAADAAGKALAIAETEWRIAQESLELLQQGATEEALAGAEARYEQAQASLKLVRSGAAPEAVSAAEAAVEQSRAALEYLLNGASKEQLEQARWAVAEVEAQRDRALLLAERYTIKSAESGVLLYRIAEQGQTVNPGSVMMTVQKTDDYWMKIYVPQRHNGLLHVGQQMGVDVSNLAGQTVSAEVSFVSPKAEFTPKNVETTESKQENTVVAVKLRIKDHLSELSPGMTARVRLDTK